MIDARRSVASRKERKGVRCGRLGDCCQLSIHTKNTPIPAELGKCKGSVV